MFRLDRSRSPRPLLEWKVRLFAAGAVLGLSGMFLEQGWLTILGIGVLVSGVLLRFLLGAKPEELPDEDGEG